MLFVRFFTTDQSFTTKPEVIMRELCSFYSDLYGEDSSSSSCPETLTDTFLSKISVPKLSDEQRAKCEEKLTVSECYNTLKTFQKNKTPGKDGLKVEFYLAFWPIFGKHLVTCLNYAHDHGELSTSQRQAVITLLEKKGRDKRSIAKLETNISH